MVKPTEKLPQYDQDMQDIHVNKTQVRFILWNYCSTSLVKLH